MKPFGERVRSVKIRSYWKNSEGFRLRKNALNRWTHTERCARKNKALRKIQNKKSLTIFIQRTDSRVKIKLKNKNQ